MLTINIVLLVLGAIGALAAFGGETWKKSEDPLLKRITMGFEPEACIVVEDSLPGIQAGISAGMQVIAFQPHEVDPELPKNVQVIRHLPEVRWLLTGGAAEQGVASDGAAARS